MAEALRDAQLHIDRSFAELAEDWDRAAAMRPGGSEVGRHADMRACILVFLSCAKTVVLHRQHG